MSAVPSLLQEFHLGETFTVQQFFSYILRGLTDAWNPDEPDTRRLRRSLRSSSRGVPAQRLPLFPPALSHAGTSVG